MLGPSNKAVRDMCEFTLRGDIKVLLEKEGEGRYTAFLARPGKGRVRVGLVLGGKRNWTGEPVGKSPPVRGLTREAVARTLGNWGLVQPGGQQLAA